MLLLTHACCSQGLLIRIILAIIYELRYFMVVIAVLLMGLSAAFAVSMPDNAAFDSGEPYGMGLLASGVLTSYLAMLGAFDIADYSNAESTAFFAIFLFLIVVVMLNLLIAIISDVFERVTESWVFEGRKMRIETIIEEELLMNDSQNAEFFPAYLQVLRPVEEAADEWAGVSGQISTVREEVSIVKREVTRVEHKVDAVEQKVDAMAAEMTAKVDAMTANQELIMEQLRSMAQ
jgi:outer membrane murein-binding lipoprotein Lpp